MTTRVDHFRLAEQLLLVVEDNTGIWVPGSKERCIAKAHVHALLAAVPELVERDAVLMDKAGIAPQPPNGDKERY